MLRVPFFRPLSVFEVLSFCFSSSRRPSVALTMSDSVSKAGSKGSELDVTVADSEKLSEKVDAPPVPLDAHYDPALVARVKSVHSSLYTDSEGTKA